MGSRADWWGSLVISRNWRMQKRKSQGGEEGRASKHAQFEHRSPGLPVSRFPFHSFAIPWDWDLFRLAEQLSKSQPLTAKALKKAKKGKEEKNKGSLIVVQK